MLVVQGSLPFRVLVGVDEVAVGVFHISSPASLGGMPLSLAPGHGHHVPTFGEHLFYELRSKNQEEGLG